MHCDWCGGLPRRDKSLEACLLLHAVHEAASKEYLEVSAAGAGRVTLSTYKVCIMCENVRHGQIVVARDDDGR